MSSFETEKKLREEGYDVVIGIDEAGRGPLAGPVVAAAVFWRELEDTNEFFKNINLIRDSKTLSEKQREELYDFIQEHFYVGVGICDHATIDRINILEATYLGMKKAIVDLSRNVERETRNVERDKRKIILVDGNKIIPNLSIEQKAIVNGDKIIKSISAASIVAKVTRDRMMREYHEKYPQYNFLKHKGYGTKEHMECLLKYGPCEIHRRSFGPVSKEVRSKK